MLQDELTPRRTCFPWYLFLLVAGLLVAFGPIIFDLLRVRQLEQAARQLDTESVAAYAQRRTDRASLQMLGARLNSTNDQSVAGRSPIAELFQQLRAVVSSHRNVSLWRMEYSQDQWWLNLQVGSLRDIEELQSGWRALGVYGEIDHVRNCERALRVQINLKQVSH